MAWTVVTSVVAAVVIVAAWPDRLAATSVPPVATAEATPPTESFSAAVSSQTWPAHAVSSGLGAPEAGAAALDAAGALGAGALVSAVPAEEPHAASRTTDAREPTDTVIEVLIPAPYVPDRRV